MTDNTTGFDFSDVTVNDILGQSSETEETITDLNEDSQDDTSSSSDGEASEDQNASDSSEQSDDNTTDTADDTEDTETSQDDVTEDDEDSEETSEDEPTVIDELQSLLGYDIEGEFTEDVKGIADFAKKAGEQIGEQYVAQLFDKFPDVKEYMTYRAQGGDSARYFEAVNKAANYKSITEETLKEDISIQKRLVSEMYSNMGYTEEEIKDTIKDLEDSELLLKQSGIAKNRLDALAEQERKNEIENQKEQARLAEEQQVNTWKEIGATIQQGSLKGLTIPEKEKQSFYDWMSKPVDSKGTTQRAQAMEKMDVESTLALEYLYYKNFDLGKIAKTVKSSSKANSLRNRLRTGGDSATSKLNKGTKGGHSRAQKLPGLNEIF